MSYLMDVSGDLAARSVGQQTGLLFAGVGAVLVLATLVAETLRWRQRGQPSAVIANLVSRIRAWWVMAIVVGLALFFGRAGVIVLFAIISLFALREFITLAPTRSGDYYALLAAFYIVLAVYQLYLNQWLQIRWRRWMTAAYLDHWLDGANHYRMQLLGDAADNPDQRIAEDVRIFTQSLEQSNVSVVERVAVMTEVSRSFEALQRGISVLMNDIDGRAITEFGRK